MMNLLIALTGLLFSFSTGAIHQPRGWNGIVPLHSTRADVERVLGRSEDPCNCIYKTKSESVHVEYGEGTCNGFPPGWNVPRGTVLLITVRSSNQPKITDLHIDLNRYVKFYDDAGFTYYASRETGVKYEVSHDGTVTGVSYIASASDAHLRWSGFPPEDASTVRYKHFDEYSKVAVTDESARLDNFAAELENNQDFTGYVIAYAGRRARAKEAEANSNQIKNYLVRKRGVDANRVVVIDGGHREESSIELYVVPRSLPPPIPTPTIATGEVQIIRQEIIEEWPDRSNSIFLKRSQVTEA